MRLEKATGEVIQEITDRERKLTPRRERFIKEMILSPDSPKDAAIRAGYSPRSASVLASRLLRNPVIQHELAQHFLDQEKMVSESLSESLIRLRQIIQDGSNEAFLKAAKLLLDYVRLAVPVLGLEIKKADRPQVETGPVDPRALIEQHREEITRLEQLVAGRAEGPPN